MVGLVYEMCKVRTCCRRCRCCSMLRRFPRVSPKPPRCLPARMISLRQPRQDVPKEEEDNSCSKIGRVSAGQPCHSKDRPFFASDRFSAQQKVRFGSAQGQHCFGWAQHGWTWQNHCMFATTSKDCRMGQPLLERDGSWCKDQQCKLCRAPLQAC